MSSNSLPARVRRRLEREARALSPLVEVAKANPTARSARSTLTSARVGLKVRLGDPDRLLDRIVERAVRDPTGPTDPT
ncbi:MAG: hypothetical protein O3C27_08910 [Actinomycetota bacterium]|nr:hypothetical protein [Actinomycetota bacterium]